MEHQNELKHQENLREFLEELGEDPKRDGLIDTPKRYVKSMHFLTSGYRMDPKSILTKALFEVDHKDLVIVRDIEFYSLCEHHLLPFYGRVHIGYIPNGKVVGLSKLPRLVNVFSRRLQVQERMTNQIAESIQQYLKPEGVGVVVEACHLCMMMRGVEKQSSYTTSSVMLGCFKELPTRTEFLNLIHSPKREFF